MTDSPNVSPSTGPTPVVHKITPSVERAADVLQKYIRQRGAQNRPKVQGITVEMLGAAFNREEIARMLFIIDSNQPDTEFSGKVWDESPVDSPVKSRYRVFADGIRMMVTGLPA